MRFGICLPVTGAHGTHDELLRVALHAEAVGMDSVWVSDHIVMPATVTSEYPYTPGRSFPSEALTSYLEPISTLSLLAARTRRVRLGTCVLVVPLRHPVLTAKMLATIDVFSGGRLVLGVGAGWMREEFEAVGAAPFEARGAVTSEYLRAMKALWTMDPASFEGAYVSFRAVHCLPHPVQRPHPPLIVGGWSAAAMRRAVELGDGWLPPLGLGPEKGLGPARLKEHVTRLREAALAGGRAGESIAIYFRAPLRLTSGPWPKGRRLFYGTADEVVEDIQGYADAGVQELVLDCITREVAETLEMISRFAADVRPRLGS